MIFLRKASEIGSLFYFCKLHLLKKISEYICENYKVDLRALALMRIGIGLVLLSDLIIRATSLTAHYTQDGILPVSLLLEFDAKPLRWSFHYLNDSFAYQAALFILNGIIALLLVIGYRTRLITFLAWIFLVSLQNRNPFIQQSGDDLLRLILFWALFMPWGNFYSWDSKKTISTVKNYFRST